MFGCERQEIHSEFWEGNIESVHLDDQEDDGGILSRWILERHKQVGARPFWN
jgi:hypothetical protein